jgi:hypothetical protein
MTLPASGAISLSDVLAELRITNPARAETISLGDADVLALAGKSAPPISLSDLYGKSSYVYTPMTVTPHSAFSSGYQSSISGGTAVASPSVTIKGGEGGYSILWEITDGGGLGATLSNATRAQCTVSRPFAKNSNGEFDVFLRCTVTDGTGRSVVVDNIEAYASWGIPM